MKQPNDWDGSHILAINNPESLMKKVDNFFIS